MAAAFIGCRRWKKAYIFVSTDELMNIVKEGRTVPRKGHTQKRDVLADPIYNNKV